MLSQEVVTFLVTIAVLFLFGIPAIQRKTKLPLRFQFKEFEDSELTADQRDFFATMDTGFADINFQPVRTFSVPNLQGSNLNRMYASSMDPAQALVTLIRTADGKANVRYIEFMTVFTDGTKLETKNSKISTSMFVTRPGLTKRSFPACDTPAKLKQKHDEETAKLGRQPQYLDPKDYQRRMQEHHEAWVGHQVSNGLLKLDPAAAEFRATPMLGFRAVLNFLNPIGNDFTIPKFVAGVLLGAGLPIVASRYGATASLWMMRTTGVSLIPILLTVTFGSFLIAGLSVGTIFHQRSFIWGFLLAYLPPPLLHLRSLYPFLGSFIVGVTADYTAKFHMRRGRLL